MSNRLDHKLCSIFTKDGQVKVNEPMSLHTTFRVGGPADYFVLPEDEKQLIQVIDCCDQARADYFILGNGSNILVSDQGYRGVVISMRTGFGHIQNNGKDIIAGGGAMLSQTARTAASNRLSGLEFAAGIPGTVGGAVMMNAGAYGAEIKDVLLWARVYCPAAGRVIQLDADGLALGYRTSNVGENGYIVLEAAFGLQPGESGQIRETMDDLARRRKEKQPLEFPSAGSTFKRPAGNFAGKLIQDAGLAGYRIGGAQVSEKHCGFVINTGGAAAADIFTLCRYVQQKVKEYSGVMLELEPKLLGEFS